MRTTTAPDTVAELIARQWGDHRPGLKHEDGLLTRHRTAQEAAARAALLVDLMPPGAEPHLGILLDNTPEFPFWLGAAALAGAAVAGINPTRRGPELARDILHTDCRMLITEPAHLPLLRGLDLPGVRILVTGTEEYEALLAPYAAAEPGEAALRTPAPDSRLLLYFTSGSTGAPKAAICTQGRLAAAGSALARQFSVTPDDVHYICMPLFHGNAVIADWLPALVGGAAVALRRRFSASAFLDDVRAYGATYFTYVGRAIQYLLATEPRPDDRSHTLRLGFGTEAGAVDAARFAERFGVRLVEGYGATEGGASVQRTPDTPPGALGRAGAGTTWRSSTRPPVSRARPRSWRRTAACSTARRRSASWSTGAAASSRGTGATRTRRPTAPATAGTGPGTSSSVTRRASSTSRAAPTTGSGSTARTWPPR